MRKRCPLYRTALSYRAVDTRRCGAALVDGRRPLWRTRRVQRWAGAPSHDVIEAAGEPETGIFPAVEGPSEAHAEGRHRNPPERAVMLRVDEKSQVRTVSAATYSRRDTSRIEWASAHSSTILERWARAWAVERRRTQPSSTARWALVTDDGGFSDPDDSYPTNDEPTTQVTSRKWSDQAERHSAARPGTTQHERSRSRNA